MVRLHEMNAFYVKALAEHKELRRLVGAIENRLNVALGQEIISESARRELHDLLDGLLAHLRAHFAEEEAGGLLDEAISRLPRLGPLCTAIERQHEPLLRQLCHIVNRARCSGRSAGTWQPVADDYRPFVQALLVHEAAENRIAEEAFGEIACDAL